MNTEPDGVTQKANLKQEEGELQAEVDSYNEKLAEFIRYKSEALQSIYTEVKGPYGWGEFVTPHALGTSKDPIIKFFPRDNLKPDVLAEDCMMETFYIWKDKLLNWFSEVFQTNGTLC